ncbi:MAG: hypothetical protein NC548_12320 [Lachnospiraceae bacterium]|nr:hypothetical protein [Lachnospiraceae bacterium]
MHDGFIRVTREDPETEHICGAISGDEVQGRKWMESYQRRRLKREELPRKEKRFDEIPVD